MASWYKVKRRPKAEAPLLKPVNYPAYPTYQEGRRQAGKLTYFEPVSSTTPVENLSGTLLPAGDTRAYPCISWCSAEQKSVQ